ncbi:MAG TPA: hypothetical protein VHO28_02560 [Ignavibacteriales bacterium]|nr:hypothetical protein [Ignavibacteriales bacterium]
MAQHITPENSSIDVAAAAGSASVNVDSDVSWTASADEIITVKRLSEIANLSERRASRTLVKMVRANLILIHTKDNGEEFFTYAG